MTPWLNSITRAEILGKREVKGFMITEERCPPNAMLIKSNYACTVIGVLLKGSLKQTLGSRVIEFGTECLTVNPEGVPQHYETGPIGAQRLRIQMTSERLASLQFFAKIPCNVLYPPNQAWQITAYRILKEMRCQDSASAICLEGLILELLAHVIRSDKGKLPSEPPTWLKRVKDICNEQFDQPISLATISQEAGINPAHLARTFRACYNLTVGEYIRRIRVNHALKELTYTDQSLVDIASAAGFYDQSHFTHVFRRQTGLTPAEYRAAESKRQI